MVQVVARPVLAGKECSDMIRVLLAYGLPLYRAGLRAVLGREQDICVVGEAMERESLLALASATSPDVVLFDGDQLVCGAVELVAHLRQRGAHGIMVFTEHPGEEELFRFLVSGAAGYESAHLSGIDLVERIRRVAAGEYLISGTVLPPAPARSRRLPAFGRPSGSRPGAAPGSPVCGDGNELTEREKEILYHLLRCRSDQEIAATFDITARAVRASLTAIFRKFDVRDRTAAVVTALCYGFVSLDDLQAGDGAFKEQAFCRGRSALREVVTTSA